MKKTIPILFAVALLGTTAFLLTTRGSSLKANSTTTSANVQTASTSMMGTANTSQSMMSSGLKDGSYTGIASSNMYEDVVVTIKVSGGRIASSSMDVSNMEERESSRIISRAEKSLNKQAVSAQSAHIDGVSGATSTSESYAQSLQSAIDKARQS